MGADEPQDRPGHRIHIGREISVAGFRDAEILKAVVVDERECRRVFRGERDQLRPEAQARQIDALAAAPFGEHLPREAAAHVEQEVVPQRVGVVQPQDPVLAVQEDPRCEIVEAVVLLFLPEVPAEAAIQTMFRRQVVIDPSGGGVVRLIRHRRRVLVILLAVRRARLVREREVLENLLRRRVDQALRDDVAGEWIADEPPRCRGTRARRERVVDLVLRTEREQIGKVAVAHLGRRHGQDIGGRHLERVRLDVGKVERPVCPDRPADGAAETIVFVFPLGTVGRLVEVVGRVECRTAEPFVPLPAQRVRAALRHQVHDGSHRVPNGGVVRRRVDLEFLDRCRGRAVGHAIVGHVGHAVDREVVSLLAGPVG